MKNKLEKIMVNWEDTKAKNKKLEKFFKKNGVEICIEES